ncbi:MAG: TonB family protein [bacterium]|nr:TonB family protein [bacterium]
MDEANNTLFLRIDGRETGPFTVGEVKDKINDGSFRRWDFIRTEGKKSWIKAENLVHLKALFEETNKEAQKGAFQNWLDAVTSGKPAAMQLTTTGVEVEKKRLEDERERLETERKRLEAEEAEIQGADEEREEEMRDLIEERRKLEDERRRIEEEEAELAVMGESVKKRRKVPIIVAIALAALVIVISIPSYIFLVYIPAERAKRAEIEAADKLSKLTDLEAEIADLTRRLNDALAEGDIAKAEDLQKELDEKIKEKEDISSEHPIETVSGKASLGGLLHAEGAGAGAPTRSSGAITSGISGQMGPVRSVYYKSLKSDPAVEGQVIVGFNVNSAGMVTQANVVSSTIGNSAVESACVTAVRRAGFGAAEGDTRCTFKFVFSPS